MGWGFPERPAAAPKGLQHLVATARERLALLVGQGDDTNTSWVKAYYFKDLWCIPHPKDF
jgi:hypothetical protein